MFVDLKKYEISDPNIFELLFWTYENINVRIDSKSGEVKLEMLERFILHDSFFCKCIYALHNCRHYYDRDDEIWTREYPIASVRQDFTCKFLAARVCNKNKKKLLSIILNAKSFVNQSKTSWHAWRVLQVQVNNQKFFEIFRTLHILYWNRKKKDSKWCNWGLLLPRIVSSNHYDG